ncbi:hypothetical protein AX14_001252 [Amanita brunnescens Koide BX004]|nr:hypothetical protein AX14_001252 [Amanita brunnescens Koide BX004]
MKTCKNKGKRTYPGLEFKSAGKRGTNLKCVACDDFDEDHMAISTLVICNFPGRYTVFPSQIELKTCQKEILQRYYTIVDAASHVTHVCHHECFFESKQQLEKKKIKAEDFQLECVKCMSGCREREMKTLPEGERQRYHGVTVDSRNGKCLTCSEFDIQHIQETILDICNYPHRGSKWGKNFRECRSEIAKPFIEEGIKTEDLERKPIIRQVGGVARLTD